MNRMQFASICLYYYGREAVKNPAYSITILSLFFIIHKLAGWTVWALSLQGGCINHG